nr:MAG TPA: hypothetical protein [Caudoviricetes sp.]
MIIRHIAIGNPTLLIMFTISVIPITPFRLVD